MKFCKSTLFHDPQYRRDMQITEGLSMGGIQICHSGDEENGISYVVRPGEIDQIIESLQEMKAFYQKLNTKQK
jgi:hypothetical protein